jgi:hypothetical protein
MSTGYGPTAWLGMDRLQEIALVDFTTYASPPSVLLLALTEEQISIRQNFRMNGTDEYTIFDLPIHVTNKIPEQSNRASCDALNNPLLSQEALNASANSFTRIPGTAIETGGKGTGLGGTKPDGSPSDGLGAGDMVDWRTAAHWIWIGTIALMVAV